MIQIDEKRLPLALSFLTARGVCSVEFVPTTALSTSMSVVLRGKENLFTPVNV
jgi:hypothetical protein